MSQLIRVHVKFVDAAGEPWKASGDTVARLFDQDLVRDDLLAEQPVGEDGRVEFTANLADAGSLDSPGETEPDLYVVLERSGREVFRTPVSSDVEFLRVDPVTLTRKSLTVDLGTHEVLAE